MTLSIRPSGEQVAQSTLARLAERSARSARQLASGKRIATAADDAAGLALATRLAATARGLAQGERNLAAGQDVVRTAEGALQTSQDDLARMRELAMQAQNGTWSADDRAVIQQEYDQLAAQLDQTARATTFAGRPLLDGSAAGSGAVVVRDGAGGEQPLPLPDATATAAAVAGRDVAAPSTLSALDAASAQLASARGRLGSADRTLAGHARQLGAAADNSEHARSRLEDVDVAVAVAEQTRDRILQGLVLAGVRTGRGQRGVLDLLG